MDGATSEATVEVEPVKRKITHLTKKAKKMKRESDRRLNITGVYLEWAFTRLREPPGLRASGTSRGSRPIFRCHISS